MTRAIFGAVAIAALLPIGVSAQGHGAQPQSADSLQPAAAPGMMQQMQGRMQGMQQMQEHMQGMQQMQERMQRMMQSMQERMQGMQQTMQQMHGGQQDGADPMQGQQMGAQGAACITRSTEGVLSALMFNSSQDVSLGENLTLSDAQRTELGAILERAQNEALATLTDEQRTRLQAAPTGQRMLCPTGRPSGVGAG